MLLQPQVSEAQRRGGGLRGGGRGYGLGRGGYGGYSRGYSNYGYNRGYGGYNRGYGGYGLGGYGLGGYGLGGYGGYGLLGGGGFGYGLGTGLGLGLLSGGRGYGGYGGYGGGYGGSYGGGYGGSGYYSSGYGSPAYSSGYTYSPGAYAYGGTTSSYQSFYPPETTTGSAGADPNAVHIMVVVPQDSAQVLIDGNTTRQTGHEREFVTEMSPGTTGTYHITARWNENGQPREETRDVRVRPGLWQVVDFNQSLGTASSNPVPRELTNPAAPAVGTNPNPVTPAVNPTDGVRNPMPPVVVPQRQNPAPLPPTTSGEPRQ